MNNTTDSKAIDRPTVSAGDVLRARLSGADGTALRLMGAHDALGALIVERTGFDGVWASGFEISASAGFPDANLLTMTEVVDRAARMATAVRVPVLLDADTGYGNVNNVRRLVAKCERDGIAGICLEDKVYPKLNSFVEGNQQLVPAGDFAAKLIAARAERTSLVIVARTESLITGNGMDDALHRAAVYEAAGADALLIHSKVDTAREIREFCARYNGSLPVLVVPTTYPDVTTRELREHGVGGVIYANQGLRGAALAMMSVAKRIFASDSAYPVESDLLPMSAIYDLQGMGSMLHDQSTWEAQGREVAERVASGEPHTDPDRIALPVPGETPAVGKGRRVVA